MTPGKSLTKEIVHLFFRFPFAQNIIHELIVLQIPRVSSLSLASEMLNTVTQCKY